MTFEKYYYGGREAVVFVDEAGDPAFRDPGNPLFVFGACAILGSDIQTKLRDPWLDVREKVLGDRNRPLHMREIGRRLRDEQLETIQTFFDNEALKRISFSITEETLFENWETPRNPVLELALEFLLRNVAELMFGDAYIDTLCIIFEDGPLASRTRVHWPRRMLSRKDGSGVVSTVPVCWSLLDKKAAEPGLEIADFIAHSVAGHARDRSRAKFEGRFRAIFPRERPHLYRSQTLNKAVFQGFQKT